MKRFEEMTQTELRALYVGYQTMLNGREWNLLFYAMIFLFGALVGTIVTVGVRG